MWFLSISLSRLNYLVQWHEYYPATLKPEREDIFLNPFQRYWITRYPQNTMPLANQMCISLTKQTNIEKFKLVDDSVSLCHSGTQVHYILLLYHFCLHLYDRNQFTGTSAFQPTGKREKESPGLRLHHKRDECEIVYITSSHISLA